MARGKNTTVKAILSNVRMKTGTINDPLLTDLMMIDILNFSVGEIAKKLQKQNHPFYMKTATLVLVGGAYSFSATDPPVDTVVKVVDASLGIVTFVPPDEYERISSFSNLYANSLIGVQEGEAVRLTKGSQLGAHSTITLHYVKQLEKATAVSDYPDIPDSHTSLLVAMMCADVYAYKNGGMRNPDKDAEVQKSLRDFEVA